ncbi:unnamed protein product, partial [Prorocentrum cordatum]
AAIGQAIEDAEISLLRAVGAPALRDQAEADQKVIGIVLCKREPRRAWSGGSYRRMRYFSVEKAVALAEPMDCVSDDRGLRSPTFVMFDMLEPAVDIMLDAAALGDGRIVRAMVADWECPSEACTARLRPPFVLGSLVAISAWESLAFDCRSRCSAGHVLDFWRDLRHQVAAAPNGEARRLPLAAAPRDDRPTDSFSANMFLTMASQLRQWSPLIAAGREGKRELLATFTSWLDACAESLTREKFLAWSWRRRASRGGFMKLGGRNWCLMEYSHTKGDRLDYVFQVALKMGELGHCDDPPEDWAWQMRQYNTEIAADINRHLPPPGGLGARHSSAGHKVHVFLHSHRLESKSWRRVQDLLECMFCVAVDGGPESMLNGFR